MAFCAAMRAFNVFFVTIAGDERLTVYIGACWFLQEPPADNHDVHAVHQPAASRHYQKHLAAASHS
jgi:hypothetical protein